MSLGANGWPCRTLVRRGLALVLTAWFATTPIAAQEGGAVTLQLSPVAAQDLARRALDNGNPALAAQIAGQILGATPNDMVAQMLLSAALSRLGQGADAARAGKQGFRLAKSPADKFEAAYLTADAWAVAGKPRAARFWLRRAADFQPNAAEMKALDQAFRALDARLPLKFSLSLGGGPTNNINGGSLHDTFYYWGIPIPIAQALPGWVGVVQGQVSYRLHSSATSEATVFALAQHRQVWLNPEAKKLSPTARANDFINDGLSVGTSGRWIVGSTTQLSLSGQVGRQWYGNGSITNTQKLSFGVERALPTQQLIGLTLTTEATQYPARPIADTIRLDIEGSYGFPLGKGSLRAKIAVTDVQSDAAGVAWSGGSLGVEWQPAPVVEGVSLGLFADVEGRDYWRSVGFRPDLQLDIGATARLNKVSVMGFAPTASLTASRTISQVVVRDTFDLGVSVGLSSSF